jgi:hypothetical protein
MPTSQDRSSYVRGVILKTVPSSFNKSARSTCDIRMAAKSFSAAVGGVVSLQERHRINKLSMDKARYAAAGNI